MEMNSNVLELVYTVKNRTEVLGKTRTGNLDLLPNRSEEFRDFARELGFNLWLRLRLLSSSISDRGGDIEVEVRRSSDGVPTVYEKVFRGIPGAYNYAV